MTSTTDEFAFLQRYPASEQVLGPIQRSEAIAIYGLLRCIRPRRVVEIGFGEGDSTEALLAATADVPDAIVTSHDIRVSWAHATALKERYPHLIVKEADQGTLKLSEPVDVLFLDASHDMKLNRAFFENNDAMLTQQTIIIVHDTGLWAQGHYDDAALQRFGCRASHRGIQGRFHQPGEVAFVRWLTEDTQEWTRVDIGSSNCFRHGFTILQRKLKDST